MNKEMPPFLPERFLLEEHDGSARGGRTEESEVAPADPDQAAAYVLEAKRDRSGRRYSVDLRATLSNVRAWDRWRQVYRFDPEMAVMLSQGIDKVPSEALDHLPYDSLYITFSKGHGAVVSRSDSGIVITQLDEITKEEVPEKGRPVFEAMVSKRRGSSLISPISYLLAWGEPIESVYDGHPITDVIEMLSFAGTVEGFQDETSTQLRRYLGCALYLASQNAEVSEVSEPRTAHSKRNRRLYPDRRPCTLHEAGYRTLAAIQGSRGVNDTEPGIGTGSGSPKSPHIRRAHWHTYHHGPKDAPTDTFVRWVAPIAVNAGGGDADVVIRDVD